MSSFTRTVLRDEGATLLDLLLIVLLVGGTTSMAVPQTTALTDAARVRQAAGFIGARARKARHDAVLHGTNAGLVFDLVGGRWLIRGCRDGNGNGLRRQEIQSGTDPCDDGPFDIAEVFPGVAIDVDPSLRGPGGEPPSADPVRFGSANLASFSPVGTCTSGSLYLRSRNGTQYAIRILGGTGRLRVLKYERRSWREL